MQESTAPMHPSYSILIPEQTQARAYDYVQALRAGTTRPGALLAARLQETDLNAMTGQQLLGKLFDTKQPQIYAETAVYGDGSDWNLSELSLLGDISIVVPVARKSGLPFVWRNCDVAACHLHLCDDCLVLPQWL